MKKTIFAAVVIAVWHHMKPRKVNPRYDKLWAEFYRDEGRKASL